MTIRSRVSMISYFLTSNTCIDMNGSEKKELLNADNANYSIHKD